MRALLLGLVFMFAFIQSGCEKDNISNETISAELVWSEDVSNIDMVALGIENPELVQNNIYQLKPGTGTISWKSSGVKYSETITVKRSGIEDSEDDVECEQEGEHEGENEGCVFSFAFSGDELSISKR